MSDLIDIIDENDKVIGKKEKDSVHEDGDWHRVSHAWVLNSKDDVLCHRRADIKKMFPGLWDVIIGGHLSSGETYEEAVKRELEEEGYTQSNKTKK
jgi:isopentenyl-diphosphate delta-isomerase